MTMIEETEKVKIFSLIFIDNASNIFSSGFIRILPIVNHQSLFYKRCIGFGNHLNSLLLRPNNI